jgi:hypothetical protein
MNARRAVAIVLMVITAGAIIQSATASPIQWLAVHLGTHHFGQLSAPAAIVVRAQPKTVGFECGHPSACAVSSASSNSSCGCIDVLPEGPTSFDVARDGSIWLLDGVRHRLLVWQRGRPTRPVRSVRLSPKLGVSDFALGSDGTIYVYSAGNIPRHQNHMMYALTPAGRVRWHAPTAILSGQALLRLGPDGVVYAVGGYPADDASRWTPLTTPTGRPLPVAEQRRRTSPLQPMPGGLRLLTTELSAHEVHFALIDASHKVVRAWRITGRPNLAIMRAVPALVGDDLVVTVDASQNVNQTFRWEHMVLRLGSRSRTGQQLALDARALWDPDGTTGRTPLRVGMDGQLYQLRTNPRTGVSVARYSLG